MTKYACGHEMNAIFINNEILSINAYMEWKETDGYDGTRKQCWNCWNKKKGDDE